MSVLGGVRVLDLGWVWAGPLVGAALAELGAEVVKVESAQRLDPYRLRGVERRDDLGDLKHEASPSFHKLNRTKQSVRLNLRKPHARETLLRLVREADLLIENFRAGTLERLGLGWSVLHAANPRLVVVAMSAGGQVGRWRDLKAYALITTALAGYESTVAYDGEPPVGGPTFGIADPAVSSYGVLAALAGLQRARRTGAGVYVDLSGVESVIGLMGAALLSRGNGGGAVPAVELTLPARDDRWAAAVVTTSACWEALGALTGTQPWPSFDAACEDPAVRRQAIAVLEGWSAGLALPALLGEVRAAGVRVEPVVTVEERNERPPVADLLGEVRHPVTGPETFHPLPWGTAVDPQPAPRLGEHTVDVLRRWLGMPDDEITQLREVGALD